MKVIDSKNLPVKAPIIHSLLVYFMIEHYQNDIFTGIASTLIVLAWIGYVIKVSKQQKVDIFKEKEDKK